MTLDELKPLQKGDRVLAGWETAPIAGVVELVVAGHVVIRWEDGFASAVYFDPRLNDASFVASLRKL